MAKAYEEVAVSALSSYLETNLPAQLATIDAELVAPVDYIQAFRPNETRSPVVQIYDEATEPAEAGHRNDLAAVDCTVLISLNFSTDDETGELQLRRYVQGIRETIGSDPTLGSLVVQAEWTDASRDFPLNYKSETRQARAVGVEVIVHDPT